MDKELNELDLHFLGIKVVYTHLIDHGYKVLAVRKELEVNPQIVAQKESELVLVVVKTRRFPEMGRLLPHEVAQVLHLANQKGGVPMFAAVGIANALGDSEEEMSHPLKDGKYIINFKGLTPIFNWSTDENAN